MKDVFVIGVILSTVGVVFVLLSRIAGVRFVMSLRGVYLMLILGFFLIGFGLFLVIGAIKGR